MNSSVVIVECIHVVEIISWNKTVTSLDVESLINDSVLLVCEEVYSGHRFISQQLCIDILIIHSLQIIELISC